MAVNVPLSDIQSGNHNLPKNKILLTYCQYGGGSALASRILAQAGYKVINTVGGIVQYKGALTKKKSIIKMRCFFFGDFLQPGFFPGRFLTVPGKQRIINISMF